MSEVTSSQSVNGSGSPVIVEEENWYRDVEIVDNARTLELSDEEAERLMPEPTTKAPWFGYESFAGYGEEGLDAVAFDDDGETGTDTDGKGGAKVSEEEQASNDAKGLVKILKEASELQDKANEENNQAIKASFNMIPGVFTGNAKPGDVIYHEIKEHEYTKKSAGKIKEYEMTRELVDSGQAHFDNSGKLLLEPAPLKEDTKTTPSEKASSSGERRGSEKAEGGKKSDRSGQSSGEGRAKSRR